MIKQRFFLEDAEHGRMFFDYDAPNQWDNFPKIKYGFSYELVGKQTFHQARYAALDWNEKDETFTFKSMPPMLVNMREAILDNVKRVSHL